MLAGRFIFFLLIVPPGETQRSCRSPEQESSSVYGSAARNSSLTHTELRKSTLRT